MNMFKGLLFLHGHFTRPEDLEDAHVAGRTQYGARTAADDFIRPLGNRAASAAWFGRAGGRSPDPSTPSASHARKAVPSPAARIAALHEQPSLLTRLLYLGGRPMHAGHNFDVEDPFERWTRAGTWARRAPRRAGSASVPAQTCDG